MGNMKTSFLFILLLIVCVLVSCTNLQSTDAGKEETPNTYIESVEEYNTFILLEVVHEPTGCHYFVSNSTSGTSRPTTIQMIDRNGKPYCN